MLHFLTHFLLDQLFHFLFIYFYVIWCVLIGIVIGLLYLLQYFHSRRGSLVGKVLWICVSSGFRHIVWRHILLNIHILESIESRLWVFAAIRIFVILITKYMLKLIFVNATNRTTFIQKPWLWIFDVRRMKTLSNIFWIEGQFLVKLFRAIRVSLIMKITLHLCGVCIWVWRLLFVEF